MKDHVDPVSFLHIDVDLYSSAQFVLDRLTNRIHDGTIIVFDELCEWQGKNIYPNWAQDEWKAFREWLEKTGFGFRVLSRDHEFSAAVEIVTRGKEPNGAAVLDRAAKLLSVGAEQESRELLEDAARLGLVGANATM